MKKECFNPEITNDELLNQGEVEALGQSIIENQIKDAEMCGAARETRDLCFNLDRGEAQEITYAGPIAELIRNMDHGVIIDPVL